MLSKPQQLGSPLSDMLTEARYMVLQSADGAISVNCLMSVSISESWFQVSPLLRLMPNAGASRAIGAPRKAAHQSVPLSVASEPVMASASVPSDLQLTMAAPMPSFVPGVHSPWQAAPVVGLSASYQQGIGQVVGESVKYVGTVASH